MRDIKRLYLLDYKNRLILLDGSYDWEELTGEEISGGLAMFGTSHTVKKAVSSKAVELIYGSKGDMSRLRIVRKARKIRWIIRIISAFDDRPSWQFLSII